jgi:hypothetical protein
MLITSGSVLFHPQSGLYPLSLNDVRTLLSDVSFPAEPPEEMLGDFGYALVHPTPAPTEGVPVEGIPVLEDGRFVQVWTSREHTPAELAAQLEAAKAALLMRLRALQDETIHRGGKFTFPDGTINHVQVRDGDRANLTGLSVRASRAIALGEEKVFKFRTYENQIFDLTPQETVALADAAFDIYTLVMGTAWYYKDVIEAATTLAGLPELPAEIDV